MNTIVKRGIFGPVRADASTVLAELQKAFHEFKAENDKQLAEIRAKGNADPLLAEKVDKINAHITELDGVKAELEKLQNVIARGNYGGDGGVNPVVAEHTKAFNTWFRKGVDAGLGDLEIKAALKTTSDPDGGYVVPVEMEKTIERVATTVSAMRRLARVMTIGTDTYKKLVNVGGATAAWVGETGTRSETSTPTLVEIAINTKELYAQPAATQTLLDDATIDMAAWLGGEVDIAFAEQEAPAFINGNGMNQPRGPLNYPTVANANYAWGSLGYIASGAAATFTNTDKLIDLQDSLKAIYQNGALFLMNTSTKSHMRKFKNGDGEYIFRQGLTLGAPDTLLGKAIEIDDNMPAIGANTYPIAYGDFKRSYLIIDRIGIRVLRDPFSNKPYILFYTTKRVGGGLIFYEALKLLKVAAS